MAVIPAIAIPAIAADTPATEATGVDSPLIEADIRATEAAGVDSLATVAAGLRRRHEGAVRQ